jgi:hypothetical protein
MSLSLLGPLRSRRIRAVMFVYWMVKDNARARAGWNNLFGILYNEFGMDRESR